MRAFVVIALCVPFLAACGGERLKTVDEANRWPVSRPPTEGLDDKRLQLLDRHVREELPNHDARLEQITLRHLLTMTAGFRPVRQWNRGHRWSRL
jgi:hypothetical protein